MKVHPQFIKQQGIPSFVVLPYDEYTAILNKLEEIEDITAIELSMKDASERFPLELVESIAAGGNPIKLFREYRNVSQAKLAKLTGLSRQFICQLESGQRTGSMSSLKKIAAVLGLGMNDLIQEN